MKMDFLQSRAQLYVALNLSDCTMLQEIDGTEVVYTRVASPKAVLLLFHGCSHSALDWGKNSSTCPGCLGTPPSSPKIKALLLLLHSSPPGHVRM